jgi:dynein heavy chain
MKEESAVQLVLFKDAIIHIVRICRISKLQKGHMVLVGVGGSGRRSLTQLAAIVANIKLTTIQVTKKYQHKDFRIDIFEFLYAAGTGK